METMERMVLLESQDPKELPAPLDTMDTRVFPVRVESLDWLETMPPTVPALLAERVISLPEEETEDMVEVLTVLREATPPDLSTLRPLALKETHLPHIPETHLLLPTADTTLPLLVSLPAMVVDVVFVSINCRNKVLLLALVVHLSICQVGISQRDRDIRSLVSFCSPLVCLSRFIY